jgi:hypothetical protein
MNLDLVELNQYRAIFEPASGFGNCRHKRCNFVLYTIILKRYIRRQYDKDDVGK